MSQKNPFSVPIHVHIFFAFLRYLKQPLFEKAFKISKAKVCKQNVDWQFEFLVCHAK